MDRGYGLNHAAALLRGSVCDADRLDGGHTPDRRSHSGSTCPQTGSRTGRRDCLRLPDRHQTFVKRVIGVPGDRIRISEKVVYRNGTALKEPYACHKTEYQYLYRDNFPSEPNVNLAAPALEMLAKHVVNGEVVVPEGKYFVLGDNRDSSLDSRYWGFVDSGDLIGKPLLIYDSEEQPVDDAMTGMATFPHRVRWGRLFKLL